VAGERAPLNAVTPRRAAPVAGAGADTPEPLTHTLRQLWLLERLSGGRNAYGIAFVVELCGDLDDELVRRCLTEIVHRHDTLRTRVVERGSEPVSVVEPPMPVPLVVIDLSGRPGDAQELIAAEARTPIDLGAAPLIRVLLLHLGADRHVLTFNIHHIAFDGWSKRLLWEEFVALYTAWAGGEPPALAPLDSTFRDSVRRRVRRRDSGAFREQIRYWERELSDPPRSEVFRRGRPAAPGRRTRAGEKRTELPDELYTTMRAVARTLRATAFAVSLSAWSLVLSRWSGHHDLLIGTPLAGRTLPGEEELIGMFVNTVPLRVRLDQDMRFADLVAQVQATTLGALENQDVAEEIAERFRDDGGTAALFQTMFSYEEASWFDEAPPGLRVTGVREAARGFALFDLVADVLDTLGSLCLQIDYDADVFTEAVIDRLSAQFCHVLARAVDRPGSRLRDLSCMDEAELRMLRGFSGKPRWPDPDLTVPGLFEEQVRRTPAAPAVEYHGEVTTYTDLNAQANRVARHLRSRGVGPETAVAIALPKGPRWAVAILAVLKAGGAYVPVVPSAGGEHVTRLVTDAGSALVITDSTSRAVLGTESPTLVLDDPATERLLAVLPGTDLERSVTGANLAYMPYTSGSTGRPKGSLVSHANLVGFARAAVVEYELTGNDAFIQLAAMSFDVHVEEMLPVWLAGGRVVFSDIDLTRALAADLFAELAEHGVTVCELTTAYWHELVRSLDVGQLDRPHRLRLVLVGGEPTSVEASRRWAALGVRLIDVYGLTETAVSSTTYEYTGHATTEWLPVGRPMAHAAVYVLDDSLREVGVGNVGQVFIGGPGVSRGLLGQPAATAARFVPDPFSAVAGTRMYGTGDTARWLPDGNLELLGRTDDQVKIRGHRVEPNEVATVFQEHPDVFQCVVIVDRSAGNAPKLLAYLVGNGVDEDKLSRYARAKLPGHLVPDRIVVMDALPLTTHGKVDRTRLPAPSEPARPSVDRSAWTAVRRRLADIYCEVLAVPSIGLTEDIFDLGAHSLLVLRLLTEVQREFDVTVPVVDFFMEPSIAVVSTLIENMRTSAE
jgi:amino acid adenylation domain-containing protein